jgi:streptogramin lyase
MPDRMRQSTPVRALLLLVPLIGWAVPGRGQPYTVQDPPFSIPTPVVNPFGIASAGGYLWFTESNSTHIGKIDTAGNITEIPVGFSSTYIAAEPGGGAVWFATNGISRMTTAGVVTNYPGVSGQGIAFTDDGGLWLSGGNGISRAVRSSPSPGTTVLYPTIEHVTTTYAATKGTDGNIWFIELDHYNSNPDHTGRLARIDVTRLTGCDATPTQCITEFPVPGGEGAIGSSLALGPDGALWSHGNLKINRFDTGRMDSGNGITQFDAPGPPGNITAGPDGALWYTSGGKVGRVTTPGTITVELATPQNAASAITAGPDGNIWFTAQSVANYIGRVNLHGAPPPAPVRGGVIPLAGRTPVVIATPRP